MGVMPRSTQDLRDIPHEDRQPPGLSGVLRLDLLQVPPELNDLYQLLTVVSGIEAPGLRLHMSHLTQAHVLVSLVKMDLLLPEHLVKVEGVLGVSGVLLHFVKVPLLSSLSFNPFSIKVGADLDQGLLRDPGLLLPCGEGLLPSCQLLLSCKELLLQLFR
jgi:hypothetical protein